PSGHVGKRGSPFTEIVRFIGATLHARELFGVKGNRGAVIAGADFLRDEIFTRAGIVFNIFCDESSIGQIETVAARGAKRIPVAIVNGVPKGVLSGSISGVLLKKLI